MSNVHCWDEKFFYVKINEGESLGFPTYWNPKPLHMAGDMRILTNSDEVVAELMKSVKVDAWTYADALDFMMNDIPLIRREGDKFIYSKIAQFDQGNFVFSLNLDHFIVLFGRGLSKANHALAEKRRKLKEDEARKKEQAVDPQKGAGKRLADTTVDPPLKRRKPAASGGQKFMADAMKSAASSVEGEQTAKPDLGGYWFAKYGTRGSLRNESVINDLDEALGQLGEVQKNQNQIPGSAHVQMGKIELLTIYTRLRAMEAELLQGVADKATIEKLEKEVVDANAKAASAVVLKDAEIQKLKEKIEADAKEHEDALGDAEYMAGEQAFYYGELIMAYFQLAYPEIDFTDPQFAVSDLDDVFKYNKISEIKDYLCDYVRKWMKGPVEESKPSVNCFFEWASTHYL
ncbi:uncharacterized protein [Euphorbia lathyris]|uniref:uncharacterized protein n=1 Tax=Euphorbia lathyris TaxID=212925 RepID=UPI0033132B3E